MSDMNVELTEEDSKSPETPDDVNNITAQALSLLKRGAYFPENLYSITRDDSKDGPIASADLIESRLKTGENLPISDELHTTDELRQQLRTAILTTGHLSRNEAEDLFERATQENLMLGILKRNLLNAEKAERALEEGGSRTMGRAYDYSCRIIVPLVQLAHPKLHKG